MSNDVIFLVINVFYCVVQRFLPNAATLATYMEIDGITVALTVYAFITSRVWSHSRWNHFAGALKTERRKGVALQRAKTRRTHEKDIGCNWLGFDVCC
jgi:hypothetical protein